MAVVDTARYIGAAVTVFLQDDRVLEGTLTVIDPFGNLLLNDVWETSQDKLNPNLRHRRDIGLVSVPRPTVRKIGVSRQTYQEIHPSTETFPQFNTHTKFTN